MLFDGFAYGMLLFLLSVGLSVTLGMMNFVNLAHCSFAMLGGYVTVTLMNRLRLALPRHPARGLRRRRGGRVVLERTLYRRLYRASDLDQCLLTIGIVFISVAGARVFLRHRAAVDRACPTTCSGSVQFIGMNFAIYRLFLIVVGARDDRDSGSRCSNRPASARRFAPRSTTSAWRAAWASTSTAPSSFTFALGSGLAGLGGALAIEMVGLDPTFALTYLIYVLIVVAVGGLGSIGGSFAAAVVLGISDMAGKYYFPWLGAFLIYLVMVGAADVAPAGLFGKR